MYKLKIMSRMLAVFQRNHAVDWSKIQFDPAIDRLKKLAISARKFMRSTRENLSCDHRKRLLLNSPEPRRFMQCATYIQGLLRYFQDTFSPVTFALNFPSNGHRTHSFETWCVCFPPGITLNHKKVLVRTCRASAAFLENGCTFTVFRVYPEVN